MTRPWGMTGVSTGVCSLLMPFACDMVERLAGVSACSFAISRVSLRPDVVSLRIRFPVSRHSFWVEATMLQTFLDGSAMRGRLTYHRYCSQQCCATSGAQARQRGLV